MSAYLETTIGSLQLDGDSSGLGGQLLQWLKPAVSVDLPVVGLTTVAPYGDPGRVSPAVGIALLVGLGVGLVGIGYLAGRAT